MRPTEQLQADGNARLEDLDLTEAAESNETRWDRYRRHYDEFVRAPFLILWNDWRSRVGMLILLLYLLMGTVGVLLIEVPYTNQAERWILPFQNMQYPLGTTDTGQDLLGLIVHSTPAMLIMIGAGSVFSTVIATIVGTAAGYKGGTLDRTLMIAADTMIAIPGLALIIVIAAVIEPRNPAVVGIILSSHVWAGLARSLRSQVLTLRDDSYVEASRIMGISTPAILAKEIIPNLMPYILINFVNSARNVIFSSVGLYFLGVLPYTNLNWGVTLNSAYNSAALYRLDLVYYIIAPLVAIVLISFGLILLSQGFDRIFNPQIRAKHAESASEAAVDEGDDSSSRNVTVGQ
ncbi:ABC transporter permease [Halogeometricum sp. S1BR25-6]|uniref:ABC transporter permease n=1 Tax=Halogeometricum salsisoli TaxID=2950536 RepID=A0ABU2GJ83_9EURY|nr:ABC transporter permease [Halogeometricum sp. S1BR25-6]MDS0300328.1 ABC transporter permease [Halogeometricum sp. S1BR25-6]